MNLRPVIDYGIDLPKGETIQRLELYRSKKRKAWEFWKPKYHIQYFAITQKGVYDVTYIVEPHPDNRKEQE